MDPIGASKKWPQLAGFCLIGFLSGLCLARSLPIKSNGQPAHRLPARDDVFIVNAFGSDMSHVALWHAFGHGIENARDAELIIIGNSRTQFGSREDVVLAPLRERGIRTFTMAVGYTEPGRFFYELIRRHDLRPKVLLVNVDDRFFSGSASPHADRVMNSSRWDGAKEFYGNRMAWWLEGRVNQVFPRWLPFEGDTFVIYGSETTGAWLPLVEPDRRVPFVHPSGAFAVGIPTRAESFAATFKKETDARGIKLVLMATPHSKINTGRMRSFGELWQVPVIAPELAGLATSDGSHLTRRSAERFGKVLVEELLKLPEIDALADP